MDPRPLQGVALCALDGRGILFSELEQKLYLLDETAAAVWRGLWVEEVSRDVAALRLSTEIGCSCEQAAGYIAACLAHWEAAGLIRIPELDEVPTWPRTWPLGLSVEPVESDPETEVFCLAGIRIAVSSPDAAISDAVCDVFGHLRVAGIASPDFMVRVEQAAEGYRLIEPGGAERLLPNPAAVVVWLKIDLLEIILGVQTDTIALHAAALLAPNGAMLLAGTSGSGKTTLAAILNARGWPSIADDVVLIRSGHLHVGGLPLAYAAKPGSWPILQDWFPAIDERSVHCRPDGRIVKYIPPHTTVGPGSAPITHVVFPNYRPDLSMDFRSCDRVAALVCLLKEARNARRHLSVEGFHTLCAILGQAVTLEVSYDDAAQAAEQLINIAELNLDSMLKMSV